MFCSECGAQAGGKFCAGCGARLQVAGADDAVLLWPADWSATIDYETLLRIP